MDTIYLKMQVFIFRLLEPAKPGDRLSRQCDLALSSLVVFNLIAVTLESVPEIEQKYNKILFYFEVFSVVVFSLEYFLRILVAPLKNSLLHGRQGLKSRLSYIFSFYGIIDLLSIIPFYLQTFFPGLDLRVLRTLRLFRILKLNHYNSALEDLFSAILEEKRSFLTTLYIFIVAFVLSSSMIYFAEHSVQPDDFRSIPDAMYWAIITLTTVSFSRP